MSEDKPRLPKLSQEVLDAWSASMEQAAKVIRQTAMALASATPSIMKNVAEAAKPAPPPKKYECDKCGERLSAYEVFESGWPNNIRHWCMSHIPIRSRIRLWWQERGTW